MIALCTVLCAVKAQLRPGAEGLPGRCEMTSAHSSTTRRARPRRANTKVDADYGRIETLTATVSTDIAWLQEYHYWPGLATIGKVTRIRETASKPLRLPTRLDV